MNNIIPGQGSGQSQDSRLPGQGSGQSQDARLPESGRSRSSSSGRISPNPASTSNAAKAIEAVQHAANQFTESLKQAQREAESNPALKQELHKSCENLMKQLNEYGDIQAKNMPKKDRGARK